MTGAVQKPVLDFYLYPSVGADDWRYVFATARVRSLQTEMLSRAMFLDMANAADFSQAADLLSATEYGLGQGQRNIAEIERLLLDRRGEVRKLFADLIIDKAVVELFRSRADFANMRLALRRKLLDKPIGLDYSNDGSVAAEDFEAIFEEENYAPLPLFMQEAIEQAVLAYYQDKDVRRIDYALDEHQWRFNLREAGKVGSVFLTELFRMQIDLTNIRTMLRLKFTESEQRGVFLGGGYVQVDRLRHVFDVGYEAVAPLFFATPYYDVVEAGVSYFILNKSFLELEQHCQDHLNGYLRSSVQITAGPQPVIAYLLLKENEIRTVRFILTAKKNQLDPKLILDRLGD